mmetsp:Transcript_18410/g.31348  ORF Transcript_18410/g.31348 Transcript_18410/m.31348 type:complete len:170 (-) Transcript_18410:74-583(-)
MLAFHAEHIQFDHSTKEEIEKYEEKYQLYGGFKYTDPIDPKEEIINIIKEKFKKCMRKKRTAVVIDLVITSNTFYELFPPTKKILGWKRNYTLGGINGAQKGATEIIKITNNYQSLNFLFGDTWLVQLYTSGTKLIFKPHSGVTITRKPNCEVKIKLYFEARTIAGFIA